MAVRRVKRWLAVVSGSLLSLAAAAAEPDLSGFWELRHDSRSVPEARLTPVAAKAMRGRLREDLEGLRWCRFYGLAAMMGNPLDIRRNAREIALVTPARAIARHIYVDGRKPVDPGDFEATTVGNSVGRWQGDVLEVETVGFSGQGVAGIPGGGFLTPAMRLVERYRLLDGGDVLSVTFTWSDPAVFLASHSYEYHYHRMPASANVREWRCDPEDPERERFFAPAIQSLK